MARITTGRNERLEWEMRGGGRGLGKGIGAGDRADGALAEADLGDLTGPRRLERYRDTGLDAADLDLGFSPTTPAFLVWGKVA